MTPEGFGYPNWAGTFVDNCLEMVRIESNNNNTSGMITLLADYLEEEVSEDNEGKLILHALGTIAARFCKASNLYNKEQLKKASMLWVSPRGKFYV